MQAWTTQTTKVPAITAEAASPTALLQAQALGKRYAKQAVLNNVSLAVEPGCILGLVGRNGAGKSTLIECLLGLRKPDTGQALLFGKPAQHINDTDKARLGYVPQKTDGFDWMRINHMLELVAKLYPRWDRPLVQRLLDHAALDGQRRLLTLSPGERQQVAIIRALALRPQLLVLDEPASALDPLARRNLLREIVELAIEDGTTIVFSTHIISDLERVASHIALLDQGQMRLHTSLDEIKDHWRRLWWPSSCVLPSAIFPGEIHRRPLQDGGWSLLINSTAAQALIGQLPAEVQWHPLSLEDVFVEMTDTGTAA